MEQLDDATLSLLSNEEVIAVNQDALGKAASLHTTLDTTELWVKQLEDGSLALGLLNVSNETIQTKFPFSALQLKGKYKVRDLWKKEDLGVFENEFAASIPAHGIVLLQIFKKE